MSLEILVQQDLAAKVSHFGLSKIGPELDRSHVSTAVKGSFGYLDPEYLRSRHLTQKSDVYSFGVVLLEVLCARPAVIPSELTILAEWGMKILKRGQLELIVDKRISDEIRLNSLRKFGEIVNKCLADKGVERPLMEEVLRDLNYVLQLQDAFSTISVPTSPVLPNTHPKFKVPALLTASV
ncbi:hypothetical protein PR202_gb25106 [Eleusine coracana subsp. coracana]|uniref:Protein kinase domain-containing protein n=1 Tax=Eleusine coracana subsp. coracana TaxID=191504 RepID=A0AAV5FNG8_ELECO|nr:hypothetical protein PR202_gb25106 [Eleusine coracana subsp. coracana]